MASYGKPNAIMIGSAGAVKTIWAYVHMGSLAVSFRDVSTTSDRYRDLGGDLLRGSVSLLGVLFRPLLRQPMLTFGVCC